MATALGRGCRIMHRLHDPRTRDTPECCRSSSSGAAHPPTIHTLRPSKRAPADATPSPRRSRASPGTRRQEEPQSSPQQVRAIPAPLAAPRQPGMPSSRSRSTILSPAAHLPGFLREPPRRQQRHHSCRASLGEATPLTPRCPASPRRQALSQAGLRLSLHGEGRVGAAGGGAALRR